MSSRAPSVSNISLDSLYIPFQYFEAMKKYHKGRKLKGWNNKYPVPFNETKQPVERIDKLECICSF